jgi:glutamate-5-semialdehyde dehydrogenase
MDVLLAVNVKLLCNEPALSALTSSSTNDSRLNVTTVHDTNVLKANVFPAPSAAYTTQHVSLTFAVHTVPSLAAAITHINEHNSHPTDCIVTRVDCSQQHFHAQRRLGGWGSALDGSTLGGLSESDLRDL